MEKPTITKHGDVVSAQRATLALPELFQHLIIRLAPSKAYTILLACFSMLTVLNLV
jgi:hypothetical protein